MRRLALLLAVAGGLAGCGFGAGKGSSDVSLTVTRDFGAQRLGRAAKKAPGSDTVMRFLQRSFRVTTRYGGGFVQSIDGISGGNQGSRPFDWFYYVNGIEGAKGAAAAPVHGGDRIVWDYHDWGATMDTPAIVGSFPEPFLHGIEGRRTPVRLECDTGSDAACATTQDRLTEVGTRLARAVLGTGAGEKTTRVLVGPWSVLRNSIVTRELEQGPRVSGVYVRPAADGSSFTLLDGEGRDVRRLGPGTGLVAALRFEDQNPTWVITGTDAAGVRAAAGAVTEKALARRFAAVVVDGQVLSAPAGSAP